VLMCNDTTAAVIIVAAAACHCFPCCHCHHSQECTLGLFVCKTKS
jgi:hypothetical protein